MKIADLKIDAARPTHASENRLHLDGCLDTENRMKIDGFKRDEVERMLDVKETGRLGCLTATMALPQWHCHNGTATMAMPQWHGNATMAGPQPCCANSTTLVAPMQRAQEPCHNAPNSQMGHPML